MLKRIAYPILTLLLAGCLYVPSAQALSGSEFNPGRIIDDAVFFNPNGIDRNSIQTFLNSKVPKCDTSGSQIYSGSTTRAAYGASKGYPAPYTCLKDYSQDTPSKPAENGLCGAYSGGSKTAATIIYDVAQSCGINPKVLIVLLQKEQSLVTDDWPWASEYRSATGYGCPDTAPCDSEYYGFFNQVYSAARQFKRYARDASSFSYRAGRSNYIQYNPNAGCGGSNVFLQSQATAGLYNYTPYQPNAPALGNLYGAGDACSAYGNRNFWRLFNDWFGSTLTDCPLIDPGTSVYRLYNPSVHDYLYTTSTTEICLATNLYGYLLDGPAFKDAGSSAGANPVYRFSKPGGGHFYTSSESERAYVASVGFGYEGIAFYEQNNDTPYYSPVFRVRQGQFGHYFYTNSIAERDYYLSKLGFINEGIVFYAPNNTETTANVYRLIQPNGQHFYTSSLPEKDYLVTYAGFRMESIEFTGRNESTQQVIPVYRLFAGGQHFITTAPQEREFLTRNGYKNEGIAFYTPQLNAVGAMPVYRFYARNNGDHILLTGQSEKTALQSNSGYIYEGITQGGY